MKLRFQVPLGAACAALLLISLTSPLPTGDEPRGACAKAEHCVLYYTLGEWRMVDAAAGPRSRHVGYVRNEEEGSWTIYYAPDVRCPADLVSASLNDGKGKA